MAITYVGTSTANLAGNWATYGGSTPNVDRNVSNRHVPWTVPVGGATVKFLERGMNCAAAQAGGTVAIGLYDYTDNSLIVSTTINVRSDEDPAEYVWHQVAVNITLAAGRQVFIASGKPTVTIYHTQGDTVAEAAEPATLALPSTWVQTTSFAREVPLRLGWDLPTTTLTLATPVRVGGTGYAAVTTGLGPVTSLTNAAITSTSSNAFIYSMNSFVNNVFYLPMGMQAQTASDGTEIAASTSDIQTLNGYNYVTAVAPLNLGAFSLAKDPAFIAGVVVHWPTSAGTINANMTLTDFVYGTYSCWLRDIDGKMYSFTLNVTPSGISTDTGKIILNIGIGIGL